MNILNMLYNLHFFYSKCRLFHNATLFGFCITHILNTGCAKIWNKKFRRQKINIVKHDGTPPTKFIPYIALGSQRRVEGKYLPKVQS